MTNKVRVTIVAGARPNFMKIAPIMRAADQSNTVEMRLVHTGQHYDHDMNDVFFAQLGIRAPDAQLQCAGTGHAEQTAKIMMQFEKELIENPADWVIVVGDVNSTLACAVVSKKLGVPVAHVEAGLRSGDMSMPEEINRLVTDAIADVFFVTEPDGVKNLRREGKAESSIQMVGHVMADNVLYQHEQLVSEQIDTSQLLSAGVKKELLSGAGRYGVVTMHRPANVDSPKVLADIFAALNEVAETLPLVFPLHPRTRQRIESAGIFISNKIIVMGPLPYMDFLFLWKDAELVLTDSGGLQEETTVLGVPCLTMRENTERPVTIDQGTNELVGTSGPAILRAFQSGRYKQVKGRRPDLWDGRSATRIVSYFEG